MQSKTELEDLHSPLTWLLKFRRAKQKDTLIQMASLAEERHYQDQVALVAINIGYTQRSDEMTGKKQQALF